MASGRRSTVFSNTAQPKREECSHCKKKGLGVWQYVSIPFETFRRKVRSCRYCNHKQVETWNTERGAYERVEG